MGSSSESSERRFRFRERGGLRGLDTGGPVRPVRRRETETSDVTTLMVIPSTPRTLEDWSNTKNQEYVRSRETLYKDSSGVGGPDTPRDNRESVPTREGI